MHFADEDIGHQFVIALAIDHLAGLQRHIRRQFHVLHRHRHFRAVERLRLLRGEPHRMHRHIAEPVARRRGLLGRGAVIGDELHDLGHVRLIPPPFHIPPAGLRLRRTSLDAFQFEQRAAEAHLVLHAELGELLHAVDLRQAAHVVEQNVRLVGLGLDQSGGEIGVVDRQHVAVIGAAGFLERLDEGVLQRVAVGIIGRDEEPFLAELLHQFRRDRLGVHRRRVADAEHVPFAIGAGDRVGVTARRRCGTLSSRWSPATSRRRCRS